jgi:hypothetical protein
MAWAGVAWIKDRAANPLRARVLVTMEECCLDCFIGEMNDLAIKKIITKHCKCKNNKNVVGNHFFS